MAKEFPFLEMEATLFDCEVNSGFRINGKEVVAAEFNAPELQEHKLCSFSVKNGKVTYYDTPFSCNEINQPPSYNQENPLISECFVSDGFLNKLINKINSINLDS